MTLERLIDTTVSLETSFDTAKSCDGREFELKEGFEKLAKTRLEYFEFRCGQSVFLIRKVKDVKVKSFDNECKVNFAVEIGYLGETQYVLRDLRSFISLRLHKHEFSVRSNSGVQNKFTLNDFSVM
jgi:hypothetical protein